MRFLKFRLHLNHPVLLKKKKKMKKKKKREKETIVGPHFRDSDSVDLG
jgi:hypothetical protein